MAQKHVLSFVVALLWKDSFGFRPRLLWSNLLWLLKKPKWSNGFWSFFFLLSANFLDQYVRSDWKRLYITCTAIALANLTSPPLRTKHWTWYNIIIHHLLLLLFPPIFCIITSRSALGVRGAAPSVTSRGKSLGERGGQAEAEPQSSSKRCKTVTGSPPTRIPERRWLSRRRPLFFRWPPRREMPRRNTGCDCRYQAEDFRSRSPASTATAQAEAGRTAGVSISAGRLWLAAVGEYTQYSFKVVYLTLLCFSPFFWRCLRKAFCCEGTCMFLLCCLVVGGFTLDRVSQNSERVNGGFWNADLARLRM